ncbi:MAG: MarR family transcriptional regulator [Cyanobacteria bacterium P01_A01_bin.123]
MLKRLQLSTETLPAESALVARDYCLCNHLRKADRVIRQIYDEALRPYGLKATQFTLLNAIRLREPIKQTDLAERMVTDRTTLTRNLSSLERQGLVQFQSGADRRVKEISLTAQGHQRLAEAYPHWKQAQTKTEELLGKHQVSKLLTELSEITRKLGA